MQPVRRFSTPLMAVLAAGTVLSANARAAWVVYYGNSEPVAAFEPFDLVVLDSENHPRLQPLLDRGKTLLGYISLGEVGRHQAHFEAVRAEGLLGQENANWPGSFFVDLRDPRWTARVVEELVPGILEQGFHGLFLDTLDNAQEMERAEPLRHAGMTAAAVGLVRAIRLQYPDIVIMLNRAYLILPDVAAHIDLALGESALTDYDFATGVCTEAASDSYLWQAARLKAAREASPRLELLTLDYWDPEDIAGVARIYARQRAQGFAPYVATIELDRIHPEPRP